MKEIQNIQSRRHMTETIGKYRIETFEEDGKNLVKIYNTNAKKEWKQLIAYYNFKTIENRTAYIDGFKRNAQKRIDEMNERKEARKNFANPAKIGDVLVGTWGYDQTNVDCYQVIAVRGKMVDVQEIALQPVPDSIQGNGMADTVVPVKNVFKKDEPVLSRRVFKGYTNDYGVKINDCVNVYLTDPKERHYRSWYA